MEVFMCDYGHSPSLFLWCLREGIRIADQFGLGRITSVKNVMADYGIEWKEEYEQRVLDAGSCKP
jgi:hypothetical protein